MSHDENYGTQRAVEQLDMRFNKVLTEKVIKPELVPPEYSDEPVPAKKFRDPRSLAQQRPVR